jgi:hypothetical protein
VLGHGHEENTGRPYLLLEAVEGKIHFLWQSKEIQAARRQKLLRVNSFVRIEKQSASTRPFLRVEDLGDSRKLLENDDYMQKTASRLLQNGVLEIEPTWGGWLGDYQRHLRARLGYENGFIHLGSLILRHLAPRPQPRVLSQICPSRFLAIGTGPPESYCRRRSRLSCRPSSSGGSIDRCICNKSEQWTVGALRLLPCLTNRE